MNIFLLSFISVFLLFIARRVKKQERQSEIESIVEDQLQKSKGEKGFKFQSPLAFAMHLASQGGIRRSRSDMMVFLFGSAGFGFLVGRLIGFSWMGDILWAVIGLSVPYGLLYLQRSTYMKTFRYGLQILTELGVTIFQASSRLEDLLKEAQKSKNKVIANECREILRESEVLSDTSINVMVRRAEASGIQEYRLLANMTKTAFDNDSSMVEIYKDLNNTIRQYFGTEKDINAKTSGMRKVGYGLSLLPVLTYGFFWSSIQPLLNGWVLIAFYVCCAINVLGVLALVRVVRVNV